MLGHALSLSTGSPVLAGNEAVLVGKTGEIITFGPTSTQRFTTAARGSNVYIADYIGQLDSAARAALSAAILPLLALETSA